MVPAGSPTPAGTRARFVNWREAAVAVLVLAALWVSWRLFDEWRRPLALAFQLALAGTVLYFVARVVGGWYKRLSARAAMHALQGALAWGVLSWLDTLVAAAVRGLGGENYALIILAPLALLLGLVVSLGGLVAAAVGGAAARRGLARRDEPRARPLLLGALAIALNLGAIVRLVTILG